MNCPHCHKPIEIQQARAGKALWAHLTPAERSAEMSRRRRLGLEEKIKKEVAPYTAMP